MMSFKCRFRYLLKSRKSAQVTQSLWARGYLGRGQESGFGQDVSRGQGMSKKPLIFLRFRDRFTAR